MDIQKIHVFQDPILDRQIREIVDGLNKPGGPLSERYEPAGSVTTHETTYPHADIAHTNRTALNAVSGVNTGDQDLTGLVHSNRTALDAVSGVNTGDQDFTGIYEPANANIQGHISDEATRDADLLDPTGWVDPTAITVTYNSAADTVTLTGALDYYWRGVKKSLTSPWTSTAHAATTGQSYFLSSNDGEAFTWSTVPWLFSDLQVAFVQHGATDLFCIREVHGCNTPWSVHEQDHLSRGTFRESGGDLSSFTLASTTPAFRRPAVSACVVHDEDLESTITALAAGTYTVASLTGAAITAFNTASAEIVPVLVNNPYYNSYAAPNWTQTLMSNNSYMCIWLVAVPVAGDADSQKYRFLWLQGQSNGNLTTQNALTPNDLNLGSLALLSPEYVFIAKTVIRYTGGNWDLTSVTNLSGSKTFFSGAAAGYLSIVTTDATLTGDGTVGNPLHVATTGGATITQAVVDLGTVPVYEKEFTITDAAVSGTSKILAALAYTTDDIAFSGVTCSAGQAAAGSFKVLLAALHGPTSGQFTINYQVA